MSVSAMRADAHHDPERATNQNETAMAIGERSSRASSSDFLSLSLRASRVAQTFLAKI